MMRLWSYWRSSASYRVRIALNLKGIPYTICPVNLLRGEQRLEEYQKKHHQGLVPTLDDEEIILTQSLAICEYLEEKYPDPPFLPRDNPGRARVRGIACAIACEIHPLGNLRVMSFLRDEFSLSRTQQRQWYCHWIHKTFDVLESTFSREQETKVFCHGDTPTLADIFLVPQIYNAIRYSCEIKKYPTLNRIYEECLKLPAFQNAAPENQPDAVPQHKIPPV